MREGTDGNLLGTKPPAWTTITVFIDKIRIRIRDCEDLVMRIRIAIQRP